MERALRGFSGAVVLLSVVLTKMVHPNWIWLTVFIGVMLLQSYFTNWCPAMLLYKKCGMKKGSGCDKEQ